MTTPSCACNTAPIIFCRSSRTLPGHACVSNALRASELKPLTLHSSSLFAISRKNSASGIMSSLTVTQRRNGYPEVVQAVQKILPETLFTHCRLQILIGGGDDANIEIPVCLCHRSGDTASCMARSNICWFPTRGFHSSRNNVPPWLHGNILSWVESAPVNAPLMCPKNADSANVGDNEPQSTATKGLSARLLCAWRWAICSLPVLPHQISIRSYRW